MSEKYDSDRFEVSYCNLFCEKDGLGVYPNELRKRDLPVHIIKGKSLKELSRIVLDLVTLLKKKQFDIVHLHMRHATIVGALASKLAGTTAMVTRHYTTDPSHAGRSGRAQQLTQTLDNYCTKSVKRIVAVSNHVRDVLIELSVRPEQIDVVHNGVDIALFDAQARSSPALEVPSGHLVIGTVGSLTWRKGHKYLIEAFADVSRRLANCSLVIVGEGPELDALRQLASGLGISERVIFAGFRNDIAALIREFDVYVQPSIYESFGIVLLEAMAATKAVVATNVGGVPEIVSDGETGVLVSPENPGMIADALIRILGDEGARIRMAEKGRSRVVANFDIAQTVSKYQDVYLGLANRNF
jgi:glycosyltransferase involved in cell wall biosynthesis